MTADSRPTTEHCMHDRLEVVNSHVTPQETTVTSVCYECESQFTAWIDWTQLTAFVEEDDV